tara:strand:- start:4707 stop:4892 length:186 start_codon:yes stop_codon:yes gene_type:complete
LYQNPCRRRDFCSVSKITEQLTNNGVKKILISNAADSDISLFWQTQLFQDIDIGWSIFGFA